MTSNKNPLQPINPRTIKKAYPRVHQYIQENNWTPHIRRNNHIVFHKEGKTPVFASWTPSDKRVDKNIIRDLKRADKEQTT